MQVTKLIHINFSPEIKTYPSKDGSGWTYSFATIRWYYIYFSGKKDEQGKWKNEFQNVEITVNKDFYIEKIKKLTKGDSVYVEGEMYYDEFIDKNNQKRKAYRIKATNLEFVTVIRSEEFDRRPITAEMNGTPSQYGSANNYNNNNWGYNQPYNGQPQYPQTNPVTTYPTNPVVPQPVNYSNPVYPTPDNMNQGTMWWMPVMPTTPMMNTPELENTDIDFNFSDLTS